MLPLSVLVTAMIRPRGGKSVIRYGVGFIQRTHLRNAYRDCVL